MGGIGKTALSVKLAELVENEFDCLIWRSLRNAPPVEELLSDLISFLSQKHQIVVANSLDKQYLNYRMSACFSLFSVLDNLESILHSDKQAENYLEGYAGYETTFAMCGRYRHQSCVLVTVEKNLEDLARGKAIIFQCDR
jgi:hypothetical protein